MRKVTMNGGPLDGRTFRVPESATAFVHHAAHGGWYDVDGTWNPDVVVELVADTSKLAAALERGIVDGASIEGGDLEEFLPKGLPRVIAEARMGRRVIVVASTLELASVAFRELADLAEVNADRIERVNGGERIRYANGGDVSLTSPRSKGGRGRSADVLYLMPGVTEADVAHLLPALNTSRVGLVLHHQEV